KHAAIDHHPLAGNFKAVAAAGDLSVGAEEVELHEDRGRGIGKHGTGTPVLCTQDSVPSTSGRDATISLLRPQVNDHGPPIATLSVPRMLHGSRARGRCGADESPREGNQSVPLAACP